MRVRSPQIQFLLFLLLLLHLPGCGSSDPFPTLAANISNTAGASGASVRPAIAADGSGNINVVWQEGTPGEIFFSRFTVGVGGIPTFSVTNRNISTTAGTAATPAIAIDGSENTIVVWAEGGEIFFSRFTVGIGGALTFSVTNNQSISATTPGPSVTPAIAVDGSGNLHVVWVEGGEIWYGRVTFPVVGGVVTPSVTNQNISSTAASSITPAIAVDASGNINVVWQEGTPGEIFFSRSEDDGVSFSTGKSIFISSAPSITPAIAVDGLDNINVVWQESGKIFFSRSEDGGTNFLTTLNISNTTIGVSSIMPAIAVDGLGNINVVWSENGEILFSRSTDNGSNFSTGKNISNTAASSFAPAIAMDGSGNIHAVWEEDISGNHEIFFALGD